MSGSGVPFVLGLFLGAGLAVGGVMLFGEGPETPSGDPAAHEAREAERGGRTASLVGRGDLAESVEEEVEDDSVTLTERGAALLYEMEGRFPNAEALQQSWSLLARLYALAGRKQDVERVLLAAIEAGVTADEIFTSLRLLPHADALAIFRTIQPAGLDVFAEATYATASFLIDMGEAAEGAQLCRAELTRVGDLQWDLCTLLTGADPQGAGSFLVGLARGLSEPNPGSLESVADHLADREMHDAALQLALIGLEHDIKHDGLLTTVRRLSTPDALRIINERLALDGEDTVALIGLAEIRSEEGDTEGAFRAYERALGKELNSDWLGALLKLDPTRALPLIESRTRTTGDDESIGMLAKAHLRTGDPSAAFEVFLRAHKNDQSDPEWLLGMARIDPSRALELLAPHAEGEGEATNDEILGNYGRALEKLGQDSRAFTFFERAFESERDDMEWKMGMVRADVARAIPHLEKHLEDEPGNHATMAALALARGKQGHVGEARDLMQKALGSEFEARYFEAWARFDEAGAMKDLRGRLQEQGESANLVAGMGYAHKAAGRVEEAKAAFKKALDLGGGNWIWHMEFTTLGLK